MPTTTMAATATASHTMSDTFSRVSHIVCTATRQGSGQGLSCRPTQTRPNPGLPCS
jgi:hypothetical protein